MMFKDFKSKLQTHFKEMSKDEVLFTVDVEKDVLWNTYLESFPEGTNVIYKERREYDCNCCKSFIRSIGGVVSVSDNKLVSIWNIPNLEYPFNIVADKLNDLVSSSKIKNVFLAENTFIGVDSNKSLEDGSTVIFEHFYVTLPKKFVGDNRFSIESLLAPHKANKDVFERSMAELSLESGEIVLELIEQNSLYKGEEFKNAIELFISWKKKHRDLESNHDNWYWQNSFNNKVSKIRNTAIGTLLISLSEGVDVDTAVRKYEKLVAPENYKRPTEVFTKSMVEAAEKKILELGLEKSLGRRHAVLSDISVNNVLFVNRDAGNKMKDSLLSDLKKTVPVSPKTFAKVEEVGAEDFISHILPNASNLEVFLEGRHETNLMTLVAPKEECTPLFKWNNNFSWSYNGNIADSSLKQNVKNAGGSVDGVFRFSIQWNEKRDNPNDFDAHCVEPSGNIIYFGSPKSSTSGTLDIDIRYPCSEVAVENIIYTDACKMKEGNYVLKVHNFAHRGGTSGFRAEIEFNGELYSFDYSKDIKQKSYVEVAVVNYSKKDGFRLVSSLDSKLSSKEMWGVRTGEFVKVSTFMLSPNYWNGEGVGNKHYFFFLEGAKPEGSMRGFYNEFLREDLSPHRKVFEALGNRFKVSAADEQLTGVGFSSTKRNSLLVKVDGKVSRVVKVIF